jgi:predicted nucleic acid-binding protein
MLCEYEAVLMRPEQRQVTGMSVEEVGFFLDGLAALLLPVVPYFLWRPLLRDPDDEMVLDAAVNGPADAIVTFNVQDFLPEARQFQLRSGRLAGPPAAEAMVLPVIVSSVC